MLDFPETSEAIILVKAAPNIGAKHGETVCCAGVADKSEWVRLYPITFRSLDPEKRFTRWDRVRFKWRKPRDDRRMESCRVDHQSIEIIGSLKKPKDREMLLAPLEVTSLKAEREKGKSFALLRPTNIRFYHEIKTKDEIAEEAQEFKDFLAQPDLFQTNTPKPLEPCPYRFKYKYTTDDGECDGTCQDWETDATYYNWKRTIGADAALDRMYSVFGKEYPAKGMVFAMGTHSRFPDTWLINGIIRLDEIKQGFLDL